MLKTHTNTINIKRTHKIYVLVFVFSTLNEIFLIWKTRYFIQKKKLPIRILFYRLNKFKWMYKNN